MLNTKGLALEQAPPIHVPLQFFLIAPLFVLIAGLFLIYHGPAIITSRWNSATVSLTHLITLGFLAQVMMGATMQLLPVLLGVTVAAVGTISRSIQILLVSGVVLLLNGFLSGETRWLFSGSLVLFVAFSMFLTATGLALLKAPSKGPVLYAMRLGWFSLMPTVGLGILLVFALSGRITLVSFRWLTDIHLMWGLLGWAGLYVIGVMIELVPMFYMTQSYGKPVRQWLSPVIFSLLLAATLAGLLFQELYVAIFTLLAMGFLLFSILTLQITRKRKRPIYDVTLIYIWLGCISIIGAVFAWVSTKNVNLLGVLLLVGVVQTIPNGMLYKIVPFLCWFHLQGVKIKNRPVDYKMPKMNDFIPERRARWQLYFFSMAFALLLLGSIGIESAIRPGGFMLLVSSSLLFFNLSAAALRYRKELLSISR